MRKELATLTLAAAQLATQQGDLERYIQGDAQTPQYSYVLDSEEDIYATQTTPVDYHPPEWDRIDSIDDIARRDAQNERYIGITEARIAENQRYGPIPIDGYMQPNSSEIDPSKWRYDAPPEAFKSLEDYLIQTDYMHDAPFLGEKDGGTILGTYEPGKDKLSVRQDLNPAVKNYVETHERVHRRRHYLGLPQDEFLVDLETANKLGWAPYGVHPIINQQFPTTPGNDVPRSIDVGYKEHQEVGTYKAA